MNNILSALNHLNCADLDHDGWIRVGMALKAEGYDLGVWDEWSRRDPDRYHPGECAKRWESFRGNENPVTGASIVKMAKDRGWIPFSGEDGILGWDDELCYDGPEAAPKPSEDLIRYLQALFEPDDYVSYVTNDVRQNEDGKWVPSKGVYYRTAGELIDALRQYPDDPGAAVGDWKPEAGAWIRFNPVDGKGIKNENITRFRFALVESDDIPAAEQTVLYRKLELPIAALVDSGGKSVHAIVRVDAENAEEYRQRVDYLYDYLSRHGLPVDRQNRNPSRLSRMPGVTRNGRPQKLLGVNLGRKSWADWFAFSGRAETGLPPSVALSDFEEHLPELPEEMIKGILRRGHKMLISGSSKAGKSFLLMELCVSVSEGVPWLGFPVRKGRVLYVNLEIDPASCIHRFMEIRAAMGVPPTHSDDIRIWNLRGHAVPLDKLAPLIIEEVRGRNMDMIVIDPIYKVITGDENSASDMAAFCNQFDLICDATGCSVVYCHHHSKGAQGAKRAMDRASGSGVFARDPDAQLDMIELELTDTMRNFTAEPGATAWRLESSLREFRNIIPVNFWFNYPIHRVDNENLREMPSQGSADAGRMKNRFSKSTKNAEEEFRNAFQIQNMEGNGVSVADLAAHMGVNPRTIRNRVHEMPDEFFLDKGIVQLKKADSEPDE